MLQIPKKFADMLLNEIKSNPQARSLDEIPQGVFCILLQSQREPISRKQLRIDKREYPLSGCTF
jgi:hypothetical protein